MPAIPTLGIAVLLLACAIAQDPPKPPAPPPPAKTPATVGKSLVIGDALPAGLSLRGIDGKMQSLDDLKGKTVVMHFWSTQWLSMGVATRRLNELSAEYSTKGVVVLGIASNAAEIGPAPDAKLFEGEDVAAMPYAKLRATATKYKTNYPILVDHDSTLGHLLDAKTTPHCFVFDKEGKLQYEGALDDDEWGMTRKPTQYVHYAVKALLAGNKPTQPRTRPYGDPTRLAPRDGARK